MAKIIEKLSNGRKRVHTVNNDPTRTQQHSKEECDVNKIIAKYKKTGVITHVSRKDGSYIDVSTIPDYHTALQSVLDAQSAFSQLPAQLRKRFNNDPSQLLSFLNDPRNLKEAISLGLVNAPKPSPTLQTQSNGVQSQGQSQTQNQQSPQTQTQQSANPQPSQNSTPS